MSVLFSQFKLFALSFTTYMACTMVSGSCVARGTSAKFHHCNISGNLESLAKNQEIKEMKFANLVQQLRPNWFAAKCDRRDLGGTPAAQHVDGCRRKRLYRRCHGGNEQCGGHAGAVVCAEQDGTGGLDTVGGQNGFMAYAQCVGGAAHDGSIGFDGCAKNNACCAFNHFQCKQRACGYGECHSGLNNNHTATQKY